MKPIKKTINTQKRVVNLDEFYADVPYAIPSGHQSVAVSPLVMGAESPINVPAPLFMASILKDSTSEGSSFYDSD
jgi:hypothetical protein